MTKFKRGVDAMFRAFEAQFGSEVTKFKRGEGGNWLNLLKLRLLLLLSDGRGNLCERFQATGCDGGYAQYIVVSEDLTYLIPERFTDTQAAPHTLRRSHRLPSFKADRNIQDRQNIGLEGMNQALISLKHGRYRGHGVLID